MNITRGRAALFAALFVAGTFEASAVHRPRQTKQCNMHLSILGLQLYGPTASIAAIRDELAAPEGGALRKSLWDPETRRQSDYSWGNSSLILAYPPLQDRVEILGDARRALAGYPSVGVGLDGLACPAVYPPYPPATRVAEEARNANSAEYRLIFDAEQRRELLSDDAWQLTGESFLVALPDACSGVQRLVRFAAIGHDGLGTEVVTTDAAECGTLRASGAWYPIDASRAAYAAPGPGGACPYQSMPVLRLFNGSSTSPNHRFTTKANLYRQMEADGWIGEGVAFCVPDGKPHYRPYY